jgi:hypothetical protein
MTILLVIGYLTILIFEKIIYIARNLYNQFVIYLKNNLKLN